MADEYTLLDYQLTAPPLVKAVVKTWREASPILNLLKFMTTNRLTENFLQFRDVTSPSWRKAGETFAQGKVEPVPVQERVYFMGKKIDIPREYVKAESLVDIRATQSEAALKGAAFDFNTCFFRNDNQGSIDLDAIVGLHHRVHNDLAAAQRFDANLDVSGDTAVTNWEFKLIDQVHDLLDRVEGMDSEKTLVMGRTLWLRTMAAFRKANQVYSIQANGLNYDTFGQNGPKILQAGYQSDQTTQILKDDESGATLTGGSDSSMYCLRFGDGFLGGFAQEMPFAEDKGETEDGVNMRTIVRFSPGIYIAHPRAVAVAYGWTAA